jgi:hypothetical protein
VGRGMAHTGGDVQRFGGGEVVDRQDLLGGVQGADEVSMVEGCGNTGSC